MGRITVVNLTDAPIQSAIANAGNIHSGINGILPNVYYHHNALSGTGYDVWVKWYLPGIIEEFPSSDLSKIGWYIGGALITALGIVTTILSAGSLAPLWAAYGTAAEAAALSAAAANAAANAAMATAISAAAADAAASAALATFSAAVAGTGLGVVVGGGGIAGLIAQPTIDILAAIKERSVGTVWGQSDRILKFTGKLPLEVGQGKDAEGKPTPVLQIPKGMTAEKAPPPTFAGDLTWDEFDLMRRKGEIYQIKHRDGEYCDITQGLVRLNLRGGGGKAKLVMHAGAALDISKIYKILVTNPNEDRAYASCLMAGEDEGDYRVYLRKQGEDQALSCCFWQFIPTREGGVDGKGGWLIVDRRYGRFLYWSGSEILQYQSEEVGATKFSLNDGWAEHVTLKGMVWNLSNFQSNSFMGKIIEQPGKDRICVTARTDQGRQIYARPYGSHDVFQVWALVEVD